MFLHENSNFARIQLLISLGGDACKKVYNASKTSALLSGDASRANRCYVVAHCAPPPKIKSLLQFPFFPWKKRKIL